MMDEKKECLPESVVTMLLQGYVNTIVFLKNATLQVQATAAGTVDNVSLSVVKLA